MRYKIKSVSCSCVIPAVCLHPQGAEDDELEEELDWIYRNAFATPTISSAGTPKSLCFDANQKSPHQDE